MSRMKLVVAAGFVMVAMLALTAGPAMADEFDGFIEEDFGHGFDHGFDDVLLLDEGTAAYDQWCSPGLPEGIWIPGCIFSDVEEDEEEIVFIEVEEDDFFDEFDDDDDDDEDHFRFRDDDKRRHGDNVEIDFG